MKIRHPKFNLAEKLTKHYFKGNAFSTHLVNSLHVLFPKGELFFIKSCRYYLKDIENPELKKAVKLFIGQEGTHAAEHQKFWKYLEQQNLPVKPFADFVEKTVVEQLEVTLLTILGEKNAHEFALALTAGLEHYTALLAEVAFENENEFKHLPDEMRHLLLWHAAEEIEHKSVAFELLKSVNNSELLKNTGFTIATLLLLTESLIGQIYFLVSDRESKLIDWPMEWKNFMNSLGKPMARKFYSDAFKYYKKDFHPSQMQNDEWAINYFAEYDRYNKVNNKTNKSKSINIRK